MILDYAIENDGDMEAAAMAAPYDSGDRNMVTIMKGVVDFQPQSKRLFQRWKKRYTILTPNSLFFFKKSTSKVGRSEMGKFICKTSLGDITKTENLKAGVIILYTKDRINFYLRSKEHADWLTLINASIERLRERSSRGRQESSSRSAQSGINMTQDAAIPNVGGGASEGFYENAGPPQPPTQSDGHDVIKPQQQSSRTINDIGNSNHRPEVLNGNDSVREADPNIETTTTTDQQEIGGARTKTTIASSAVVEINSSSIEQQKERNGNQLECSDNVSTSAHLSENGKERKSMINDDVAPAGDEAQKEVATRADKHFGSGEVLSKAARDGGGRPRRSHASKHSPNQSTQNSTTSSSASTGTKKTASHHHLDHQDGTISRETLKSGASCGSNSTTDKLVSGGSGSAKSTRTRDDAPGQTSIESRRQDLGDEHHASLQFDQRESDICELASANKQSTAQEKQQRVLGRRDSKHQERPNNTSTNLIRRDDSWQSLVSLTQAGRPVQRPAAAMDRNGGQPRRPPSFDSTATPMRNKPLRQQSLQAYPPPRRLPFFSETSQHQWQASSIDVPLPPPQIPSSPSLQYNHQRPTQQQQQQQQTPTTSYHQKLLQLQMLHQQQQHHNNGNNIDYIRQSATPQANLVGSGNNDYQIYGPESIATTNHYGYYSMRSNLKSAASEFSFIRPSSSNIHKPTLPSSHLQPFGPAPPNLQHASFAQDNQPSRQMTASPSVNGQYLLQGPTASPWQPAPPPEQRPPPIPIGGHIAMQIAAAGPNQAGLLHPALVADLAAPNRDLPLKPNKRRQQASVVESHKNSSSGSSIVRFLKRAFSTKRSRRRAKLAESCSSSMMGANFEGIQVAPQSAYSTGSKDYQAERGAYLAAQQQQSMQAQSQPQQQQRMIDLIEAFANKTALDDETYQRRSQHLASVEASRMAHQQQQMSTLQRREIFGATRLRASGVGRHPQMALSGSTLQKSNSISTSSGFGMIANQHQQQQQGGNFDREATCAGGYMPLVTRSTKVMSANLTPVFSRKDGVSDLVGPSVGGHFASPRHSANFSADHHPPLPRPSSIYGQPSMISSPVISNGRSSEFGVLRNSSHGYPSGARVYSQNPNIVDFRRHQQASKAPFLGTTCEVAEEMISSPTGESKPLVVEYGQQHGGRDPRDKSIRYQIDANGNLIGGDELASPRMPPMLSSVDNYSQHHQHRQAIVNPILQSPTMSLIYDNHPSIRQPVEHSSHYDNAGYPIAPMDHQPQYPNSISSMELASRNPLPPTSAYYLGDVSDHQQLTSSPFAAGKRSARARQSYNLGDPSGAGFSPARQMRLYQQQPGRAVSDLNGGVATPTRTMAQGKPAAIVTPSTPRSSSQRGAAAAVDSNANLVSQPSPVIGGPRSNGAIATVSPIASRRFINHPQQQPTQYQQSPLVNRHTRVLKRGDGVQATVMGAAEAETSLRQAAEVNVGGRIHEMNSEASASRWHDSDTVAIVHSVGLRSTETDNSCDALQGNGFPMNKSEIDGHSTSQSKDEEVSSSRSTGSSSCSSTATKSIGRSAQRNNKSLANERSGAGGNLTPSRQLLNDKQRRRGSSSEQSDELSSQTGSIDEPEEKNWVNSKLMQ